jgi:hypothetical protein
MSTVNSILHREEKFNKEVGFKLKKKIYKPRVISFYETKVKIMYR